MAAKSLSQVILALAVLPRYPYRFSPGIHNTWVFGVEDLSGKVSNEPVHITDSITLNIGSVPDGGATIAMLGLGVVGLAVARRRKA